MSTPVTLTGRMANEPILQFSANGKPIARFTVVTDRRKKDDSGNWVSTDVSWWKCSAFDQLAENICEYLQKGTAVIVAGTASQDDWTDKDGVTRTSLKCVVNNLGEDLRWRKTKDQSRQGSAASFDDQPPFL